MQLAHTLKCSALASTKQHELKMDGYGEMGCVWSASLKEYEKRCRKENVVGVTHTVLVIPRCVL